MITYNHQVDHGNGNDGDNDSDYGYDYDNDAGNGNGNDSDSDDGNGGANDDGKGNTKLRRIFFYTHLVVIFPPLFSKILHTRTHTSTVPNHDPRTHLKDTISHGQECPTIR